MELLDLSRERIALQSRYVHFVSSGLGLDKYFVPCLTHIILVLGHFHLLYPGRRQVTGHTAYRHRKYLRLGSHTVRPTLEARARRHPYTSLRLMRAAR